MIDHHAIRKRLEALEAEYAHATRQVRDEESALGICQTDLANAMAARKLLQDAAQAVQEATHSRMASVVTRCLKAVFGDDSYEFRIDFQQKRGKTEARLLFARDGLEIDDPLEALGGGVVDVAALALRVACLMSSVPRTRRLLVLDEPLKHLSRNHHAAARRMLEALSEELGIQIIMSTHSRALMIGKVIELG